ncbi:MAG: tRNA pseudouridine(38-40) synthase TruA [Actinomycetota bacterium]
MRVRLDLGYDGTEFSGWATQPGRRTVEGDVSAALTRIMRSSVPVALTVAGRTDAGVHARGQVLHADIDLAAWEALPGRSSIEPSQALLMRLRGVLAADIVVRHAAVAPRGFDARFSAVSRQYRYRICDQFALLDPIRRRDTVMVRHEFNVDLANEAARYLAGLRDFQAFCRRRPGATTVRTLLRFDWSRDDDGIVVGIVEADAFCHSMVRALVGAIAPVAQGKYPASWPAEVLDRKERDPRVVVMPAHGLSLERVRYPPDSQLAQRAHQARAVRTQGELHHA